MHIYIGEGNGNPLQYSCLENPWTEEPGGLQSMRSQRVGHDWATSLSLFTLMHWRRKWQPTPVFLLENPRDGGTCWAAVYGVTQSRTRLKWLSSSSSSLSLLQGIFPTQGWNPCLLNGQAESLPLSHLGSPKGESFHVGKKNAVY